MTYRETRDRTYLEHARAIASFILNHPNLPEDGVPYWDYNAPGIPDSDRDVSAASIMASALYELRHFVPSDEGERYQRAADRIVQALWSNYRAPEEAWPFVLDGSVGNMNILSEVDVPIIYADYYFIEALRRRPPSIDSVERFTLEAAAHQARSAWSVVPEILARIHPPQFPDHLCDVTQFGASPDSTNMDDRPAILEAVAACATLGGGRVLLPPGDYLSNGPIHLENNIDLHLEEGATLRFGTNPAFYTPLVLTRWEGTFAYNYSPLIYAFRKENVAVTGKGVIDGQAEGTWSRWKRDNDGRSQETEGNKPRLRRMGAEGVPVEERIFGNGILDLDGDGINEGDGSDYYLRPSLVQFVESRNVLLEGVTLKSSPFWTSHFVLCENVIVRGTTIRRGTTNDDGIDPDGSRFVLIEDNDIHVDDDAIAIKAGRDEDGRRYPGTAFVVIRNNRLHSSVGGSVSIGSEMSGGVEWVFVENNVAHNESGRGLYIKSNMDRGGFVRNVYVRDLDVLSAAQGFEVTSDYHGYRGGNAPADVHDIFLEDVRIRDATEATLRLLGQDAAPVRRIFMRDVSFRGVETRPQLRVTADVVTENVTINGQTWHPRIRTDP
jgi:polygalacturonase